MAITTAEEYGCYQQEKLSRDISVLAHGRGIDWRGTALEKISCMCVVKHGICSNGTWIQD